MKKIGEIAHSSDMIDDGPIAIISNVFFVDHTKWFQAAKRVFRHGKKLKTFVSM